MCVENKKVAFWSQDSHGAVMDNLLMEKPYHEGELRGKIEDLNPEKTFHGNLGDGTTFEIKYSLEQLCGDLLMLEDKENMFLEGLKEDYQVLLTVSDGYHIAGLHLPRGYKSLSDDVLLEKLSDNIADMKNSLMRENDFTKHSIDIFRNKSDFDIGIPITLKDITPMNKERTEHSAATVKQEAKHPDASKELDKKIQDLDQKIKQLQQEKEKLQKKKKESLKDKIERIEQDTHKM